VPLYRIGVLKVFRRESNSIVKEKGTTPRHNNLVDDCSLYIDTLEVKINVRWLVEPNEIVNVLTVCRENHTLYRIRVQPYNHLYPNYIFSVNNEVRDWYLIPIEIRGCFGSGQVKDNRYIRQGGRAGGPPD